jgi:hypothetical protein
MKILLLAVLATSLALAAPGARAQSFANFESGHVRPLALAPGGGLLFAVNTPDNRLAIYAPTAAGLALVAEVPVGLEPVAVACARSSPSIPPSRPPHASCARSSSATSRATSCSPGAAATARS